MGGKLRCAPQGAVTTASNGNGGMKVSREQVLAYRIAEHGLHRTTRDEHELGIVDLGVQDTANATARLALAARLSEPPGELAGFTLIWSYRGAPHLHRSTDVPALASALWPFSEPDAQARLAWQRARFAAAGMPAVQAYSVVAGALRECVAQPSSKGATSAAVTRAVPDGLSRWCQPCQSTHIFEHLLRLAALPAGIRLELDRHPATLVPIQPWPALPDHMSGISAVIAAYLRYLGPATPSDVAGFLGTTRKELLPHWPDGLSEVVLDGKKAWLPADRIEALRAPSAPPAVCLLPPADPYLQARDRDLLVPDKAAQKTLWRILGSPGALLVDGEVAGVWRAKTAKAKLSITVEPFAALDHGTRTEIEAEAAVIAAARAASSLQVRFSDA